MNKEIIATTIIIQVIENLKQRWAFAQLLEDIESNSPDIFKEILDSNKENIVQILGDYGL